MQKIFLRWWIIFCLSLLGLGGLYFINFYDYLWRTDLSKLSFIILAMFFLCSGFIGALSWSVSKGKIHRAPESALKPLWFFSEVMVGLGLIGTLVGFYWVLTNSFETIDVSKAQDIKIAMQQIGIGVGTAILTSLVGMTSSIITKLQLVNLEHGRDREVQE